MEFFFDFLNREVTLRKRTKEKEKERTEKKGSERDGSRQHCVYIFSFMMCAYIFFFNHDVCVYSVESLFYDIEYILYTHHRMCSIKNTLRILYES